MVRQARSPAIPAQQHLRHGNDRLVTFTGADSGPWLVTGASVPAGEPLLSANRIAVTQSPGSTPNGTWELRGVTSNERYVTAQERRALVRKQEGLGRPEATCAALIPIKKNTSWWELPQDSRRAILAERSRHIELGLDYLPAIARRLYHCRDLGEPQPFDFITWFEFAPADAGLFDQLVKALRRTEEWAYVEREVDIRLSRVSE